MRRGFLQSWRQWYGLKSFEIFAYLQGYTFRVAQSLSDLEAVYQIRWEVYREAGYIHPASFPDRRMKDRFDEWSFNLLAFHKEKPVGTLRLTPLYKGSPILELFSVAKWPDPQRTMEIGRFAVLAEERRSRLVALGLIGKMTEWSLKNHFDWWVGYAPHPLLKTFRPLFRYEVLPTLPLGEREKQARQVMAGYFKRYEKWLVVFQSRVEWVTSWHWRKVLGKSVFS